MRAVWRGRIHMRHNPSWWLWLCLATNIKTQIEIGGKGNRDGDWHRSGPFPLQHQETYCFVPCWLLCEIICIFFSLFAASHHTQQNVDFIIVLIFFLLYSSFFLSDRENCLLILIIEIWWSSAHHHRVPLPMQACNMELHWVCIL